MAEILQFVGTARVGKPGGNDHSGLEAHPLGAPPSKVADACLHAVGVEESEGDFGDIRGGDAVPVRIVVRLLNPRPEPLRRTAQPTACEVGLACGEREKGTLAVKIGARPAVGKTAVRDNVLDRDGVQELARQIGVGPQQVKSARVTGGQTAGLDGQPGGFPFLSHAQRGFESELGPLLGDLPLFQVVALGEGTVGHCQFNKGVDLTSLPEQLGQAGSHVRFVGGKRGQSVDEVDQGVAGWTVLRPEPGLGRFVTELQGVTIDEQRVSEVGRKAVHEGGRHSAQFSQDFDGHPGSECGQGLTQTVDLRTEVVGVLALVHQALEEFVEQGAFGMPRLTERDQTGFEVRGRAQNKGLNPGVAAGAPMEFGRLRLRDRTEHRL